MQGKIRGDRGAEDHLPARTGMPHGKLPGVQELTRKVRAASVNAISGDGVSEVFEVDAYLVRASGLRLAFEKAESSVTGEQFPRGLGRPGAGPVGNRHAFAVDRVARDGAGDHAGRGPGFAADDGEVSFPRGAFGELPGEGRVRGIVFRHEDAPARVFVQAVHHAGAQGMASVGKLARVVQQGIDQSARPVARCGVHNEARRFVQANEVLVLVDDVEGDFLRLRGGVRGFGRRFLRVHFIARTDGMRGLGRGAIDRNEPAGNGALPACAAHVRPSSGQPTVEARRGVFGNSAAGHERNAGGFPAAAQGLPWRSLPR